MKLFELLASHGHARLAFHHDEATGLRAIIAIHSTVLGNALGGTRRWAYHDEAEAIRDVLRLSEGMTYKAAAADLPMGGAKSVILAKPGQTATEAEARAMGDLKENGDYHAAREQQGMDEAEIRRLEERLRNVSILDEKMSKAFAGTAV